MVVSQLLYLHLKAIILVLIFWILCYSEQTTRYYEEAKVCEVISLFISTTVGSAAFALSAPLCRENYISANVATVMVCFSFSLPCS